MVDGAFVPQRLDAQGGTLSTFLLPLLHKGQIYGLVGDVVIPLPVSMCQVGCQTNQRH